MPVLAHPLYLSFVLFTPACRIVTILEESRTVVVSGECEGGEA